MLIHDKFYCEGNDNYDKFYNIVERLTQRQNVEFALYCAKDVFHLVNNENKGKAKCCIDLVEKWLKDEKSVTSEELSNVAYTSWVTAHAAYWAADSASWAAANASWTAANAAAVRSAANAAWNAAAVRSANAAVHAVTTNSNKLNEYLVIVNSYLTKTNISCPNYEIEGKILYLIDELEENIIVHKDKYYVNMNGIDKCPEYGFDSQEELLEKLLYSEDRFWEFVRNWLDRLYQEGSNVSS